MALPGIAGSLVVLASVIASHAMLAYGGDGASSFATLAIAPSSTNTPRGPVTASLDTITLPWRVAGTLLSPDARLAQVVVVDADTGGERTVTVKEGDMLEGYRVLAIDSGGLKLERNGRAFALPVSNPVSADPSPLHEAATDAADAAQPSVPPASEAAPATTGETIHAPGPAAAEAARAGVTPPPDLQQAAAAGELSHEQAQWIRGQVQAFLQVLQRDERFREQLEQVRQELLNAASAEETPAAALPRK